MHLTFLPSLPRRLMCLPLLTFAKYNDRRKSRGLRETAPVSTSACHPVIRASAIATILLLVPVFRTVSEDRRKEPCRLSVATFNARFLFDGRPPEGDAYFPWKNDPAAAHRHLLETASLLRLVDADLIHIAEVENLETLQRLALELNDSTYRPYLIPGRDTVTGQNVGFLSRVDPTGPLLRTDEWARGSSGGPPHGVSKNYGAVFRLGAVPFFLIGLHLLAFPEDLERAAGREGQAEVVRRFAARQGTAHGRFLIILGDFNDYDSEVPDVAGSRPVTRVLETIRAVDESTTDDDLGNPATDLPPHRRFSAFVDRNGNGVDDGPAERALTDHVLLSLPLLDAVTSVEIFTTHRPIRGPSDHFPLKVTLDLSRLEVFTRGDANRDGVVSGADALAVLRYLFRAVSLECLDAADADDDGQVRVTDAVYLLLHFYRSGPLPPAPGVLLPGPDPTEDELSCEGNHCP